MFPPGQAQCPAAAIARDVLRGTCLGNVDRRKDYRAVVEGVNATGLAWKGCFLTIWPVSSMSETKAELNQLFARVVAGAL
jgi:hypothetical protein